MAGSSVDVTAVAASPMAVAPVVAAAVATALVAVAPGTALFFTNLKQLLTKMHGDTRPCLL
jgi:hypothetical protein